MMAVSVHEVLLAAAVGRGSDRIHKAADAMMRSRTERGKLFLAAERSGSAAVLMSFLSGIGIATPPEEYGIREAAARECAMTDSMRTTAGDVFSTLDDAGISFVPLKGADPRLERGSRVVANPMDDVDVLVRREDVETAGDELERAGFRFIGAFSGAHMNLVSEGIHPVCVEVHWDLVNREDPVQSALFRPDMSRVWKRMENIGGRMCLGGEDSLCYFAAHAVKEYFRRPKWLADIAFMVEKTGWGRADDVSGIADEWGVRPILGLIVAALIEVTGDVRFGGAIGSCALDPGLFERGLATHMLRSGGLGRLRPLLWLAAAHSPKRLCAVTVGMAITAMRKMRHHDRM